MIYIGLDDTDNAISRGTGRLARSIAGALSKLFDVLGVTRHQLLVDPRVPYTSHNSSATIHIVEHNHVDLPSLADEVEDMMRSDLQAGSDPGLCVARTVPEELVRFGQRAKSELVGQAEARDLAERHNCILRGIGGTQDGVIGALASVALASTGEDGRFILVGTARELEGIQTVPAILESGISEVRTMDGRRLTDGLVNVSGRIRPAFRGQKPVLYVDMPSADNHVWQPVKLD